MSLKTLPLEHRLAHQAILMAKESDLSLAEAINHLIGIELQSETSDTSTIWPNSHTAPNILAMARSIKKLLNKGVDEWKVGRQMMNPATDKDSMHVFYLKLAVAHGLITRKQAASYMWTPTPCPSRPEFYFLKANNLWNLAHWELYIHNELSAADNRQQEVAV